MTIQQILLCVFALIEVLVIGYIYQKYNFYISGIFTVIEVLILWSIGLSYIAWIGYWIITFAGMLMISKAHGTEKPFELPKKIIAIVAGFLFYKLIGAL